MLTARNRIAMAGRSVFAAGDKAVPEKLRQRIQGWQEHLPASQDQQYGVYDKYLNCKFKASKFFVKPQPHLHASIDERSNELLEQYGADPGGSLPTSSLEYLRAMIKDGNASVDSTYPSESAHP